MISIRFPNALAHEIVALAQDQGVSVSKLIRASVREKLTEKKQPQPTTARG